MTTINTIGRGCTYSEVFTSNIYRCLDLAPPVREAEESDEAFLIRRLKPIQWISRRWMRADLEALSPDRLDIAAQQICAAAADYCQDRIAERLHRSGLC